MAWLQLTFEIENEKNEHAELLSDYLSDAGALAVTLQDAKDHHSLSQNQTRRRSGRQPPSQGCSRLIRIWLV